MSARAARLTALEASPDPVSERIPFCVPEIAGNEWAYLKDCLDTNWVSSVGAYVDRFEQGFAARLGLPFGIATVNGTAALHVALLVAGVAPDDEVILPSLTFIAPANAVRYCGAWPLFIDAEPKTWQLDLDLLADFLAHRCTVRDGRLLNRDSGRRIAALLPVHVLGHPVDMARLCELARHYGLPVIEDAAESLGAECHGRQVGTEGDIACFSFNGNKVMTTGGGGMIVTRDPAWAERARHLTTTAKAAGAEGAAGVHSAVGFNYRLTNLQAAMGCAQLERLDELLARKREIAGCYQDALAEIPGLEAMPEARWARSAFWLYTIRVLEKEAGITAAGLQEGLKGLGIESRRFWQPLHLSPAHGHSKMIGGAIAERLYGEMLSIPCSCGLTRSQQSRVIEAVTGAFTGAFTGALRP